MTEWGNINDIPPNQKRMEIWGRFWDSEITNPKVFEQIEHIIWNIQIFVY